MNDCYYHKHKGHSYIEDTFPSIRFSPHLSKDNFSVRDIVESKTSIISIVEVKYKIEMAQVKTGVIHIARIEFCPDWVQIIHAFSKIINIF